MLDTKGYQIGNIIFNGRITEIGPDYIKFHDGYTTWNSNKLREWAVEPQELYEIHLEKFGFEKRVEKTKDFDIELISYWKNEFVVILLPDSFEIEIGGILKPWEKFNLLRNWKYVHELQNIYHLITGLHLEFPEITEE